MHRIGLISDTHGLLRAEALDALRGYQHIIHAGDIGNAEILERLAALAPLTVVRGNNDTQPWAKHITDTALLEIGGKRLYVLHDVKQLAIAPAEQTIDVVIAGHSHRPVIKQHDGWLFVNPGSAGPRRFSLPISVGEILVSDTAMSARIVELKVDAPPSKTRTARVSR